MPNKEPRGESQQPLSPDGQLWLAMAADTRTCQDLIEAMVDICDHYDKLAQKNLRE